MTADTSEDQAVLLELGRRWAEAELAKDVSTLETLVHPEFRLVGPFGFILDRQAWLDRYQPGQLDTSRLIWDQVEVRVMGDTAISIGRQSQQVSYQGRPNDGDFRITHVFVKDRSAANGWVIAGMHLSPIMQPPVPAGSR